MWEEIAWLYDLEWSMIENKRQKYSHSEFTILIVQVYHDKCIYTPQKTDEKCKPLS